ncbi:MAG: phosphomannomutase/phosphoglucomutase [Polyangiaceae bacterium]|nr:phosphomannomutase/phosphoglucomutase [Polyangiaceae bacterium]MCW5792378.1 phosphomannomutase/phosphoglucomutase [Polyangiaceae bacterium]
MSPHIFREYDIRGVAERDLTDDMTRRIGAGLAELLRPASGAPPHVVVGRDCRGSGPRLFEALLLGLTEGGARVSDVGVGPTPLVYFGVHHLNADGGVMITGSHNPADENGFKIMKGKASFFGDDLRALRDKVLSGDLLSGEHGAIETVPIDEAYLRHLIDHVSLGPRRLKVVLDAGNGAGGPLGVRALRAVGVDVVPLYCDLNGSFPNHHPDPTVPENLTDLIRRMEEEDADVGLALDGDADRLGVVDRGGEIIWGDRLLALFAREVLKRQPGAAVIGDVKCSQRAYDDIERRGGRPIMWRTGHSLIKAKMKLEGAALAGEMSGHFFFADRYLGFDDGLYAALRLVEVLSHGESTLGELLHDLPSGHATPELRVDCPDDRKQAVVARVKAALTGDGEVSDIDGVRVTYADGAWALVRASNTGPLLVLRFEAPTEERLAAIRGRVEALVEAALREGA